MVFFRFEMYLIPFDNYFTKLAYKKGVSFHDFTNNKHKGNVIWLVQLLEGINFPQAVARLLDFKNQPFTLSSKPFLSATHTPKSAPETAKTTFPVQNPVLINYIQERAIPISLGKKYLHEVLTKSKGKTYYTLGFRNDSNGFALRNRYFKGCQGIQDITTLDMESRKSVAVFEGFFDFLSALVFYKLEEP